MKDVTSTSFGLLIAFFLPGLTGFYGLVFWLPAVERLFGTFLKAESNVGLFFLVFAGAVVIGLQVTLLRWIVFELILCRSIRLDPADFKKLGTDDKKLVAFRAIADESYRYHQFWGGMCIVMPILFIGWIIQYWPILNWVYIILSIIAFVLLEVATGYGAERAFKNYVERGKAILGG